MAEHKLDDRAVANMEIVLDQLCENMPDGHSHQVRAEIAERLIKCARRGGTSIKALTDAGKPKNRATNIGDGELITFFR